MASQLYLESMIPEDRGNLENPRSFKISNFPSVVGRSPECDYRITNPLVSRRHCYFFKRNDEIWVRDLDSRNGTAINGETLDKEKPVHEGDQLNIGCLPYRVHESGRKPFGGFSFNHEGGSGGILQGFLQRLAQGLQKLEQS